MLKDTVSKLEAAIQKIHTMDTENKAELVKLLSALQSEVVSLDKTHAEHARSIAGFAEAAAHEVSRSKKSVELHRLSLEGLSASVKGFEVSHPALVETVNEICSMLARIGI
ncbi:MAG: DUF4404 family protein [bacterium]